MPSNLTEKRVREIVAEELRHERIIEQVQREMESPDFLALAEFINRLIERKQKGKRKK